MTRPGKNESSLGSGGSQKGRGGKAGTTVSKGRSFKVTQKAREKKRSGFHCGRKLGEEGFGSSDKWWGRKQVPPKRGELFRCTQCAKRKSFGQRGGHKDLEANAF